ncbi:hypothetical protein LTR03_007639 [Friedmanniomyces endolithicus]|nr:hypothetical protein LTR03_007639 [Friedmanniomyces endolithicus]
MAPMKQSKFRALLLKAKTRFAERKHASAISQQATNLILLAHDLNDQLQKAILEAQNLTALAKTKDAPLSDYEKRAKAYNAVVDRYQRVQINLRVLQEKVASYREDVRGLEGRFVPARKMGKVEHDVEAVGNAAGNLEEGVVRLAVEVGWARRAAM